MLSLFPGSESGYCCFQGGGVECCLVCCMFYWRGHGQLAATVIRTRTDGGWKPKKLPALAPAVQGVQIDCAIVAHLNNVQHIL